MRCAAAGSMGIGVQAEALHRAEVADECEEGADVQPVGVAVLPFPALTTEACQRHRCVPPLLAVVERPLAEQHAHAQAHAAEQQVEGHQLARRLGLAPVEDLVLADEVLLRGVDVAIEDVAQAKHLARDGEDEILLTSRPRRIEAVAQ